MDDVNSDQCLSEEERFEKKKSSNKQDGSCKEFIMSPETIKVCKT